MIKIITYAHKRPDFIYMQYESIKKYVKSEYEYIVFNNSVDDSTNYNHIHEICKKLDVKCVDVELLEELRITNDEINFTSNRYTSINSACAYSLIWTFKKYLSDEKLLCIIDSDMFFIEDIDLESLMNNKDIFYIPQYRENDIKYVWNAFVCLNIGRNPELLKLNWHPGYVGRVPLDVGGQTHYDLLRNNFKQSFINEYSIYSIKEQGDNRLVEVRINGNVDYNMLIDRNNTLVDFKQIGGFKLLPDKSFPHEKIDDYYATFIKDRIVKILDIINNDFPEPIHIGFLQEQGKEDFFIIHYKSGSNYLSFSTKEYNDKKTSAVRRILNDR